MMSVVSAMSVVHISSVVTACVLCLYLPTYTHTTDTTDINTLIVRARERDSENFEGVPQISATSAAAEICTATRTVLHVEPS